MRARSTCKPAVSHAMPPGNVTYVEPKERALIVAWYESAVAGAPEAGETGQ
jgi:uncharacterized membrane protein